MEETIWAEGLCKAYGNVRALTNVGFSVRRGEALGLLGANGAGKTTAVECILGTKKRDAGKVSVLGMDPQKDRKTLFERVGVQFQETGYPEKIRVAELCEATACLYQKALSYPALLKRFGLLDKLKKQVSELSGGQRQRLFTVLALLPDPEVLFLDELTTGLDARARQEVWKHLSDLKRRGRTLLLTSHFMDEVEALCDRILILKGGRSVFTGTVEEAVASSPCATWEDAYLWFTDQEGTDDESI